MFKINQSSTFKWPVKFDLPVDGGKVEAQTFDAEFKRLGKTELTAAWGDLDEAAGAEKVVREVTVGWKGITEDGQEVPFSQEALDRVLEIPGVIKALLQAYTKAVSGEAARKN